MPNVMAPLLEYDVRHVQHQLTNQRARLDLTTQNASPQRETSPSRLDIQNQPAQLRVDTYEARASKGLKSVGRVVEEAFDRDRQAGLEIVAQKVDFGNAVMHIERGVTVADQLWQQYFSYATRGNLEIVTTAPADISWTEPQQSIQYTPFKVNTQWNPPVAQRDFVPGDASLEIQQHPSISFQYVGDWNYVPPRLDARA